MTKSIVSIKRVNPFRIADITVENEHHFELENGIIAHNSMFPTKVVAGGQGTMLAADNVFILGRQQDKDGTGASAELNGYNFIINVEKSRYVKEKSKIPITVSFDKGIRRWSGLFDLAIEGGYITAVTSKTYQVTDPKSGELFGGTKRKAVLEDDGESWKWIFSNTDFATWLNDKFSVSHGNLIQDDDESIEDLVDQEV